MAFSFSKYLTGEEKKSLVISDREKVFPFGEKSQAGGRNGKLQDNWITKEVIFSNFQNKK